MPKLNLKQNKNLGQHWLVDEAILLDIASSLQDEDYDLILEVGPGKASLTKFLLKRVKSENKKLFAIEFDQRMFDHLHNQFPGNSHLSLINEDYLKFNEQDLQSERYIIIANLPYNISSPIAQKLIDVKLKPVSAALLLQKEVADRLNAEAGQKSCSPLSIKLNNFYETDLGVIVPKTAFDPPPKVTSRLLKLKLRQAPLVPQSEMKQVMKLVNFGFKFRRKKLINNLDFMAETDNLKKAFNSTGIDLSARAENLNLSQWQSLTSKLVL